MVGLLKTFLFPHLKCQSRVVCLVGWSCFCHWAKLFSRVENPMFQTVIIIKLFIHLKLSFFTRTGQVVFYVLQISNKVILLLLWVALLMSNKFRKNHFYALCLAIKLIKQCNNLAINGMICLLGRQITNTSIWENFQLALLKQRHFNLILKL